MSADRQTPWGPLAAMRGRRPPFAERAERAARAAWTPAYAQAVRRRCWACTLLAALVLAALAADLAW